MQVKYIQLNNGYKTAVDEEDYDRLIQRKWYVSKRNGKFYVQSDYPTRVYMHREIMNCPEGKEVDHIDGIGLNNCKFNLRICTHRQNSINISKQLGTYSIYKGVSYDSRSKKWYAYIKNYGIRRYLGSFKDERNAAKAYNKAAIEIFGEFAKLNNI